jgi:hypothetical protein
MREQAMKADRDADAAERIQQQEHENVVPAEQAVPQLPAGKEETEDRYARHDPGDEPHLADVGGGLYVVGHRGWAVRTLLRRI